MKLIHGAVNEMNTFDSEGNIIMVVRITTETFIPEPVIIEGEVID